MKTTILFLLSALLTIISQHDGGGVLANMIQDEPLRVNQRISVVGASYADGELSL